MRRLLALLIVPVLVVACADNSRDDSVSGRASGALLPGPADDSISARDVDAGTVDWPWRQLDSEPVITIGRIDGPDAVRFDGVTDGFLATDGTIVIADQGSAEVRWFGSDGRILRRTGGRGDGPGEFRPSRRSGR